METQSIGLVIAFLGVVVSLYIAVTTAWGLKKQMQLTAFTEYTCRYNALIESFRAESEKEQGMSWMRQYFNLCWEEWYLVQRGGIDKNTWDIWKAGIRNDLRARVFQDAWAELRPGYGLRKPRNEFLTLIDGAIKVARDSVNATSDSGATSSVQSRPKGEGGKPNSS